MADKIPYDEFEKMNTHMLEMIIASLLSIVNERKDLK